MVFLSLIITNDRFQLV